MRTPEFWRRQTQIAARKIRRLKPVGQGGEFNRRKTAGRFARERQFIRRGLRDFGHRVAQRRADAVEPLAGGGLRVELLVVRNHQRQLGQLGQQFQSRRGDFPVIIDQIGPAKLHEQFRRQGFGPRTIGKNSAEQKIAGRLMQRLQVRRDKRQPPPGNLVVGHHHGERHHEMALASWCGRTTFVQVPEGRLPVRQPARRQKSGAASAPSPR